MKNLGNYLDAHLSRRRKKSTRIIEWNGLATLFMAQTNGCEFKGQMPRLLSTCGVLFWQNETVFFSFEDQFPDHKIWGKYSRSASVIICIIHYMKTLQSILLNSHVLFAPVFNLLLHARNNLFDKKWMISKEHLKCL